MNADAANHEGDSYTGGRSGVSDGGAVSIYGAWCNEIDDVGFGGVNVEDGACRHVGDNAVNAGCVNG